MPLLVSYKETSSWMKVILAVKYLYLYITVVQCYPKKIS